MYGDSAAEGKSGRGGRHGRARPVQLILFPFLDLVAEDVGVTPACRRRHGRVCQGGDPLVRSLASQLAEQQMGAPAINAIPVRRRQPDDLIDWFRLTHTAEAWRIEKKTV